MNILGLMSGSSLDGLDMALCSFSADHSGKISYKLIDSAEIAFPDSLVTGLRRATSMSAIDLFTLEAEFNKFLGQCCNDFEQQSNYVVDLIASHGHTIFHSPENHFTIQIGNGGAISQYTKKVVVSDFRSSDVAAKGQGAPFAPIADYYLFPDVDVMINIGGITNLSAKVDNKIIAFDVSPANQLMNHLAAKIGNDYDFEGSEARKGTVDVGILSEMKAINNLLDTSPRGMDNSWVTDNFLPLLEGITVADGLRTCIAFISDELISAVTLTYPNLNKKIKIKITGGGAFNTFLMEEIERKLSHPNFTILQTDTKIIKFKEAILMALMGFLRVEKRKNVFKMYTGADRDTIGGCIYVY